MSGQLKLWDDGGDGPLNGSGAQNPRASIGREIRYLLAISTGTSRLGRLSPAGLAHSLGVALIEDFNMSRGKGKSAGQGSTATMPRFVDVKLDQESRSAFEKWSAETQDCVYFLQKFADSGYRVGVTWSGEHQTYTVSATCRDEESPNNGLCMTAFSGSLVKAVQVLWYKHAYVAKYDWSSVVPGPTEDFG